MKPKIPSFGLEAPQPETESRVYIEGYIGVYMWDYRVHIGVLLVGRKGL